MSTSCLVTEGMRAGVSGGYGGLGNMINNTCYICKKEKKKAFSKGMVGPLFG